MLVADKHQHTNLANITVDQAIKNNIHMDVVIEEDPDEEKGRINIVTVHTPLSREVFWHEYAKIPRHTAKFHCCRQIWNEIFGYVTVNGVNSN
mgnify:CR=1 FL=1